MNPAPGASLVPGIAAPDPIPILLRDLIHDRLGIYFENGRLDLMLDKLHERAAARKCASFLDYYYILKYDAMELEEWRRVMDAFSVQETFFWREHEQIQALVDVVVPAWFNRSARPLHIWSAACASGEEPYSLAMALRDAGWGSHPIRIIASDASDAALEKARRARFRERSFRSLPAHLRTRYFERDGDIMVLKQEIRDAVEFRWANLVAPETYVDLRDIPVIFCRNVFIYFSPGGIQRVIGTFSDRMPPGGHLFVGASESLLKLTTDFDLHEIAKAFVYLRRERDTG